MIYRSPQNRPRFSLSAAEHLVRQAFEAAAELRRDSDLLPVVNADGSSECPFAEDLFFQKERTAQFIRDDLKVLREFADSASHYVEVLGDKLQELAQERGRLHGQNPQRCVLEAEAELREQAELHRHVHKDLLEAIAEVEATLRESAVHRFPGGDPRGYYGERISRNQMEPRSFAELMKDSAKEETQRLRLVSRRASGQNT